MKNIFFNLLFIFISFQVYAQTTISGNFIFEGLTRTYRIYIPAIYNSSTSVPLVFNLHGYGSNNVEQESYGDFRPISDTANFIIVHPNGTLDSYNQLTWNSFGLSSVNDIGFLSALIDTIEANYNIDINRIYCTGLSNGGFMSFDVACYLSNRICAIASVAGSMIQNHVNSCTPIHPTPIMEIHGTADGTVPYNGYSSFLPVDTIVKHWVLFNNCSQIPTFTNVPNINTIDGCTAEHFVYNNGNNGSTVELYKIIGGGHSWPGALVNLNVTNMDFSASIEIWRFFSQYKLDNLSNINYTTTINQLVEIYPNPSNSIFILNFYNNSVKNITVYNSIGQIIDNFNCSKNVAEIYIKESGFYIIKIVEGNNIISNKIIKL